MVRTVALSHLLARSLRPLAALTLAACVASCGAVHVPSLFGGGVSSSPAGPATELVATVPLNHTAGGAAVDPGSHMLWIRGSAAGMVALDTATRQVSATILLPTSPDPPDLDIDPATHLAYAPVAGPAVVVVDLNSRARVDTIPLAGDAHGVALDRQRKALYVAIQGVNGVADASALAVIDTDTRQVTALIPMPIPQTVGAPKSFGVAVDTETGIVFVTNQGSGTVSMVDPSARRVMTTIPVGRLTDGPVGVAVDSAAHQAYVAVYGRGIAVIDEETRRETSTIAGGGQDVAVDPPAHALYVTNPNAGTVSVIDTQKQLVIARIRIGRIASGVAVDPDSGTVYVTDSLDGRVSILAAGKGTRTAPGAHAAGPRPETPPESPPPSAAAPSATANPSAAAIPAPNALAWQFKSRTGNIVCHLASTGAACEIRQHHYPIPPRPANCQQAWGDRIAFDVGSPAIMACHTGNFSDSLPTQAYNAPLSSGAVSCVIDESTGVTCRDSSTGHFLRLSQQSYDVG